MYLVARGSEAVACATRAVELLRPLPESAVLTHALPARVAVFQFVGHRDIVPAAEEAAASAERTGIPALRTFSRIRPGRARVQAGDDTGMELMLDGLASARAAHAYGQVMTTYASFALGLYGRGRHPECRHYVDEGLAYAREYELWFWVRMLQSFDHRLLALGGDLDDAVRGLRAGAAWPRSKRRGSPMSPPRPRRPSPGSTN